MRARNIKPGFFKNEYIAELSFAARLLFVGLWCAADREGRIEKRALRLKAEIFPYDSLDINGELTVIERKNFIQTYVVGGKEYIQVLNFKKHQNPHHTEAKSKLPEMTKENILTEDSPLITSEYPSDSLILRFTDSLIPNTEEVEEGEIQFSKMSINDFRFLFSDKFGQNMPGGCNATASELCQMFTKDEIIRAFDVASEQGKLTIAYVKGVLMGNGDKKQNNVTRLQTFADAKEARAMEQHRAFLEEM